jgi:Family of unknown function (DUF6221)
MDDALIAFFSARVDDSDAAAKAAAKYPGKDWTTLAGRDNREATVFEDAGSPIAWIDDADAMAVATHMARHDPRRALREVEADRKLLHALTHPDPLQGPEYGAGLRLAAMFRVAVWDDHPDYDTTWRPDDPGT